jgi:hypothetical protein
MRELASKDRVSRGLGDVMTGRATELGGERSPDPKVPAPPAQRGDTVQNRTELPSSAIVSSLRERLELHPHFRGRTSLLKIESIGGSIVLSGCLPSYYLKQLLQEAVKESLDGIKIDNHVEIVWPASTL